MGSGKMTQEKTNQENNTFAQSRQETPSKKIKSNKLWLKAGIGIAILLIIAIGAVCCVRQNDSADDVQIEPNTGSNYAGLIENWNKYANSAQYQLFGDRAQNPQAVVDAIKKWCAVFTQPLSAQAQAELDKLGSEQGKTTFHQWEEFRKEHYQTHPLDINADMQPEQIATALNSYLHITMHNNTPNYITPDTVKTIIKMNNLCQFFEMEKANLHKAAIDTEIHVCGNLGTNGAYPALDDLLK